MHAVLVGRRDLAPANVKSAFNRPGQSSPPVSATPKLSREQHARTMCDPHSTFPREPHPVVMLCTCPSEGTSFPKGVPASEGNVPQNQKGGGGRGKLFKREGNWTVMKNLEVTRIEPRLHTVIHVTDWLLWPPLLWCSPGSSSVPRKPTLHRLFQYYLLHKSNHKHHSCQQ